jgi:hypothetical protein
VCPELIQKGTEVSEPITRASVFRPLKKTVQGAARWLLWDRIWPMIETRVAPLEARVVPLEARVVPLEARVAPLEARVAPLEARVAPLEARVAQFESGWRQHLPAFLNSISTVRSFGFELSKASQEIDELRDKIHVFGESQHKSESSMDECRKSLDEISKEFRNFAGNASNDISGIWQRIEFVRREILFELKYGRNASVTDSPSRVTKSRVIASEKLAAAQTIGLRINLGCGHIPLEGYVNVDQRELPGVDVLADVGDLPIGPGTVQEIFSAHLVEHFPQEMLRRRLLPYWKTLLAPGGVFRAIVPDGEAMLDGVASGNYPFEDFREVLFGAQDYDGDFHFNLLTPPSFIALLHEAGFTDITVPVKGRRNWKCFEFEIRALSDARTRLDSTADPVTGPEQTEDAREP